MKKNPINIILISGIVSLLISCENVYVSTPQPVDSKNIYSFPREFRGIWMCEGETIIIGKDYFKYAQNSESKIPKQEIDSSPSYVLKNNKIYIIDNEEKEITEGFPFKLDNDTIFYQESGGLEIALGKKAFLRKVKKNYILNFKDENQWWQVILIRKDKIGNIIVGIFDIKELDKYSNYIPIHTFKGEYSRFDYIEANWTKKELWELINKGAFSDTLAMLRLNKTFCN